MTIGTAVSAPPRSPLAADGLVPGRPACAAVCPLEARAGLAARPATAPVARLATPTPAAPSTSRRDGRRWPGVGWAAPPPAPSSRASFEPRVVGPSPGMDVPPEAAEPPLAFWLARARRARRAVRLTHEHAGRPGHRTRPVPLTWSRPTRACFGHLARADWPINGT